LNEKILLVKLLSPGETMITRLFLSGLALLLTCGCSAVGARYPVGERPAKIVTDNWQGKWICREGEVTIKVDNAERGLLTLIFTERDEPRPNIMHVELLESNGWLFANTRDWSEDPKSEYVWGRVRNEEGQITIWAPIPKEFKRLVTSGAIPGKFLSSNDVVLDQLKPAHLRQITSVQKGLLFDWHDPFALVRVRDSSQR
jgi:hypothetical protein